MADRGGEFSFFQRCPCKNWYLHFYQMYDHQIWQAGTSTGFNSNDANQADAGDFITSKSRDKLKHIISRLPECLWPPNLAG